MRLKAYVVAWLFMGIVCLAYGCMRIPYAFPGDNNNLPCDEEELAAAAPKQGTCMCVKSDNVIVRTTGCQKTEIRVSKSSNECFTSNGQIKKCPMKGVPLEFYVVNYQGQDRLIAKAYLEETSDNSMCVGCNKKYLGSLCSWDSTEKLTHAEANKTLYAESIPIVSSGECSTQTKKTCTSLTNVNCVNIKGIIWLKRTSKLDVVVTGGTETGHSKGTYSHWNGYKIDIRYRDPGTQNLLPISKYIPKYFEYIGIRKSDKALKYRDSNGFEYNYEWTIKNKHWDILYPFKSCIKLPTSNSGSTSKTMCVTTTANVRDSDCKTTKQVSKGKCFTSKGENMICMIGSTPYNMHRLDINGMDGWVASSLLEGKTTSTTEEKEQSTPTPSSCSKHDGDSTTTSYTCYGDITKLKPTGASSKTAKQDGLTYTGVKASQKMTDTDLAELEKRKNCYDKVGKENCIEPGLIAALASRESRGGKLLYKSNGYGDGGKAYGILQCDTNTSGLNCTKYSWDSCEHMDMMMKELFTKIMISGVKKKQPYWSKERQLQGAVAAYNFGVSNVQTWARLDIGSTGDDYSNDVIARAQYLKTKWGSKGDTSGDGEDGTSSGSGGNDICSGNLYKKLTHAEAKAALDAEDITIDSSGNCDTRSNSKCTSLEQVNCINIKGVIWLKKTSGASVVVTGGTEEGHSTGTHSHYNGYKLDIRYRTTQDITKYILKNFRYFGVRSTDEALMYRDPNGFEYNYEWKKVKHWDILYPPDSSITSGSSGYSGTNGKCMCVTGTGINVRKSDCSATTKEVSKPSCYTSKGENIICMIDNIPYNMHRLDIDGEDAWVASKYLKMDETPASSSCSDTGK